jgi:hypothetical protein
MYQSEEISYETGMALVHIFNTGHLNKGQFEPIPVAFIKLSLAKIDTALSKDLDKYAGSTNENPGHARNEQKILNLREQIGNSKKVQMPWLICIQNNPLLLHVSDGRHRLAYLYEEGKQYVWCVIPEEQYDLFQTHFS